MNDTTSPQVISNSTLAWLFRERIRQREKFGNQPLASMEAFIRIAGEEFGEICSAVNQGKPISEIRNEILQLAAVCIAWIDGDLHDGRAA